ncbi:helix-turn-helix transcriptional regulator [Oryzibacter oryziterrae]|uniref:helix-turn-helix transcriptional regulator n=1 Tax=Oryzibacter oryziterrae TaxID=2766474 RepID=UPI001F213FA0|nr:helix-turn-helix transcriptional regulator [Oryzibacter oryziterrae]
MSDFLTTREIADLLRVKERKVYDLVAKGEIPVRRVTGKLLFARAEIENWMAGGKGAAAQMPTVSLTARQPAAVRPSICVGGHDPLLEWALRESRSGIAAFLDGALDGIERAAAGECIAAGLHIPEADDWNVGMVAELFGGEPWVLLEWAKRKRGLLIRRGLGASPRNLRQVRGLRFQSRQPSAGSELVLTQLLDAEGMTRDDLTLVSSVERSESDLGLAIATGRAEVGLGIEAAARQFGLDFVPLVEERFDLMIWRQAFFEPPMQRLMAFCRSEAFAERARDLGGYDVSGFGTVHFNGA